MKRFVLLVLALLVIGAGQAKAETAVGVYFGYPGNAGLSLRFDRVPIAAAWSEDYLHATIDTWWRKTTINERLDWYAGPGLDAGIPFESNRDFQLSARVPFGLQYMATPKIELFGEIAPGLQFIDEVDFYWATNVGVRWVLGR